MGPQTMELTVPGTADAVRQALQELLPHPIFAAYSPALAVNAEGRSNVFPISAATGEGIDSLLAAISQAFDEEKSERLLTLGFSEGRKRAWLHQEGVVQSEEATEDGYTLTLGAGSGMVTGPLVNPRLAYKPEQFVAIGRMTKNESVIVVNPASGIRTLKDLIATAKAKPGKLNFGSGGNGGVPHLALELLNSSYNLKITHVPYKGSSDAVKDLLGGPIDVMCDAISVGLSQIKAGKLKALAVTTESRHPALPDTPTTAEAGYAKFQVTGWQGWVAPAGTPRAILDRVNAETNKAMNDPATRAKLFEQGYLPAGGSVDAFAKQLAADQVKWAELVKVSGARID